MNPTSPELICWGLILVLIAVGMYLGLRDERRRRDR